MHNCLSGNDVRLSTDIREAFRKLLNAVEWGKYVHLAFDDWAAVFVGALNSVFLDTGKTKHGVA